MKDLPKGGLIGRTVHFAREVSRLRIPLHAANAGYFIALSVFPGLLLVLSILRLTPLSPDTLVRTLAAFAPPILMEWMEELIFSAWLSASGVVAGLSALTALWSASRGVYGLLTGLNAVYETRESRGYWHTRLISVGYTFVLLLMLLLSLGLQVFGSSFADALTMVDAPAVMVLVDLLDLRLVLLGAVQSLVFTLMYMVLPDRPNRFRESLPGGVLTALGWMVFSQGFSVYVVHFDRYANIFGSVYALALGMLWLYFCLCILFFGGVVNRWRKRE